MSQTRKPSPSKPIDVSELLTEISQLVQTVTDILYEIYDFGMHDAAVKIPDKVNRLIELGDETLRPIRKVLLSTVPSEKLQDNSALSNLMLAVINLHHAFEDLADMTEQRKEKLRDSDPMPLLSRGLLSSEVIDPFNYEGVTE